MHSVVFKYKIPDGDLITIELPSVAKTLRVDEQLGDLYLWALVDTETPLVARTFRVAATGDSIEEAWNLHYIGTVFRFGHRLVHHVFEQVL